MSGVWFPAIGLKHSSRILPARYEESIRTSVRSINTVRFPLFVFGAIALPFQIPRHANELVREIQILVSRPDFPDSQARSRSESEQAGEILTVTKDQDSPKNRHDDRDCCAGVVQKQVIYRMLTITGPRIVPRES